MEKRGFGLFLLAVAGMGSITLSSTAAAAVPLQLKLGKGKTYYQKMVMDQRLTQTVMGTQQVMDQSTGTGLKLDVLDVDNQGTMRTGLSI